MDMTSKQELRFIIIKKLIRLNKWGGYHTDITNLKKGTPTHLQGDIIKEAKIMIKETLLISKPSTGEIHVSLNPTMKAEIDQIYKQGAGRRKKHIRS